MSDPARLPDERITYSPTASGNPSSFRGEKADGWIVSEQDKPYAIINLTNQDGETPSLLEKVVIGGNIKLVAVWIKLTPTGEFQLYKNEPIDVSKTNGQVSFADVYDSGIKLHELRIDLLEQNVDDVPFMARFNVFACIEGKHICTIVPVFKLIKM